jgi:hypothetical protein
MGVAALVLGIIGLLISLIPGLFLAALPFGVLALILGIVGRKSAASNGQPTGSATAGMVLGIIAVAFAVTMWVLCGMLVKGTKDAFEKGIGGPIKEAIEKAEKASKEERLNGVPLDRANAVKVTAARLAAENDANSMAAEQKYGGRTCEVTGVVRSIEKAYPIAGVPPSVDLTLATTAEDLLGISCHMPVSETEKALKLAKGQTITVLGKCDLTLGATLKGCVLK